MATINYPETNLTASADLAPEISIDYVNRFGTGVQTLQQLLGISSLMSVPRGASVKTYKYTADIKDGNVAEGDYIPLSKVSRALDKTIEMTLQKFRRNTSAEAIQDKGLALALNDTDSQFVGAIEAQVKSDLIEAITSTTATSPSGDGLQGALAQMWGALNVIFEDITNVGGTPSFVFFANPTDVATYLGSAQVSTQTAFGLDYLESFLGLGTLILSGKIPVGSVFGTAAGNINIAYVPASGGDVAQTFGLTSDATGLVGITHSTATVNATVDTLLLTGVKIFPEVSDAVLKGTIAGES